MSKTNYESMRPKNLYEEIIKQRDRDGLSFHKAYHADFIETDCPACGAKRPKTTFNKLGYSHAICPHCKTLFCSPRPTDSQLDTFYNHYQAPQMWTQLLLASKSERKKLQYAPRVETIISILDAHAVGNELAADLGAGSGAFASCLNDTGRFAKTVCLDLSSQCVSACQDLGMEAMQGGTETLPEASCDLISLNDLAEHLPDPARILEDCHRALKPGGIVSIATPNNLGFDFLVLGDQTVNITPPEHLNYFNTESITTLLERCGFNTVFVSTPGKLDVAMVQNALANNPSLLNNDRFLQHLMKQPTKVLEEFQQFLADNLLSSHMLVLAQKGESQGRGAGATHSRPAVDML